MPEQALIGDSVYDKEELCPDRLRTGLKAALVKAPK